MGISEQIIGFNELHEPYPLEEVTTRFVSETVRPWGFYRDIFRSTEYVLKTIHVKPGARLSLQSHERREEIWKVLKGCGRVYQEVRGQDGPGNGVYMAAYVGDVFQIGCGDIHRLQNIGEDELIVLELQIGQCLESDIVRLEDDWGRE